MENTQEKGFSLLCQVAMQEVPQDFLRSVGTDMDFSSRKGAVEGSSIMTLKELPAKLSLSGFEGTTDDCRS